LTALLGGEVKTYRGGDGTCFYIHSLIQKRNMEQEGERNEEFRPRVHTVKGMQALLYKRQERFILHPETHLFNHRCEKEIPRSGICLMF
jgi:hypothetical protein